MKKNYPSSSKVVVIGGGVAGTSCAYHLAKFGWKDVVSHSKISMGICVIWYPLVRRTSTIQVQSSFVLLENVLGKILKHTPSSYTLQMMRCPTWKLTWLGQN